MFNMILAAVMSSTAPSVAITSEPPIEHGVVYAERGATPSAPLTIVDDSGNQRLKVVKIRDTHYQVIAVAYLRGGKVTINLPVGRYASETYEGRGWINEEEMFRDSTLTGGDIVEVTGQGGKLEVTT